MPLRAPRALKAWWRWPASAVHLPQPAARQAGNSGSYALSVSPSSAYPRCHPVWRITRQIDPNDLFSTRPNLGCDHGFSKTTRGPAPAFPRSQVACCSADIRGRRKAPHRFLDCRHENFKMPVDSRRRPPYMRDRRPDGGIGRRAGFRYLCREAWRFESSSGHQIPISSRRYGVENTTKARFVRAFLVSGTDAITRRLHTGIFVHGELRNSCQSFRTDAERGTSDGRTEAERYDAA